jgi:(2Fe-2S) ferredoxin
MARFRHLLFVCQKERPPDDPKGSCVGRGSAELLDRLKELTHEHGLKGQVRVTSSGCLDYCAKGITVFAFSPGTPHAETWYTGLTPQDAERLFDRHVVEGQPLSERVEPIKPKP